MHYQLVWLTFILYFSCGHSNKEDGSSASGLGGELVSELRNDANLDLSVDEEYEDLRAELLAYHTALASLSSRRTLVGTPCWRMGGICINYKLCEGAHFITEIPGCKDRHNVCCFRWNAIQVRDLKDKGIHTLGLPWSKQQKFGGRGLKAPDEKSKSEEVGSVLARKRHLVATPGHNSAKAPIALIYAEK